MTQALWLLRDDAVILEDVEPEVVGVAAQVVEVVGGNRVGDDVSHVGRKERRADCVDGLAQVAGDADPLLSLERRASFLGDGVVDVLDVLVEDFLKPRPVAVG